MQLLLDLGNTRAHLARSPAPGELGEVLHVAHDRGRAAWEPLVSGVEAAWVASVVPALVPEVQAWLLERGVSSRLLSARSSPVELDVVSPETVGADRIANALWAARARPGRATIVIDLGTAITFEVVDAQGVFRGGAIAPGLRAQAAALAAGTAQLPPVTVEGVPAALGRDTPSSIAAGVFWGVVGLVETLTRRLADPLEGPVGVVATGGDAVRVADACTAIDEVVSDLTLLGMSYL